MKAQPPLEPPKDRFGDRVTELNHSADHWSKKVIEFRGTPSFSRKKQGRKRGQPNRLTVVVVDQDNPEASLTTEQVNQFRRRDDF